MKLLDAAEVIDRADGNWEQGWDSETLGCGSISVYLAECDPDVVADIVGDSSDLFGNEACGYRVIPFGVVAALARGTRNARESDMDWLKRTLRKAAEIPVARGLMVRQGLADTWIGNPDVEEIAAPTLTDRAAVQDAVSDARQAFFGKTFGLDPIFHVNPANMLALRDAGVIQLDPVSGEDRTVWGDPVVISEGYHTIAGMTPSPVAFYTGPIEVSLGSVKAVEEIMRSARTNRLVEQVTMLAAIDTAPCAMVRIGAAPAPLG